MEAQSKIDQAHNIKYLEKGLSKVCGMTGDGTLEKPYKIKTKYGECEFCHAGHFFKGKGYPDFVKQFSCHDNSYNFATKRSEDCYIIAGIGYRDVPFLHSVIVVGTKILDFNYNLLMDASLYMELFNFELITLLSSDVIKEHLALINDNAQLLHDRKITFGHINFCFYDVIAMIEAENQITTV